MFFWGVVVDVVDIWLDEDVEKDERKRSSKTKKKLDKVLFFNQIKFGYKKELQN